MRFWFLASLIACLLIVASPLLAQQAPALVTQAVDNSVRTVLPHNVHPLARAEYDQGEAPADLVLHRMMLVLKRSDQQETTLRRLIENQQNKKSSSYLQWLTPDEFGAKFGPADSDIAAVTNWLTASGFQVTQVSNGRTVIEFNGTAGQVKQAFGTAIHKYVINGQSRWANAGDPSIPTALAPVIAGVNSLNGFPRKAQNIYVGTYSEKTRKVTSSQPNFTFPGCSSGDCYAVGPYDFATIYDLLPLWNAAPAINGTGQTIAIVGDTDIYAGDPTANPPIPSDAVAFWNLFGLDGTHAPQPTLNIITNGPDPGFNGDENEADIDTQWSGAVAPGATIDFVTSADTETVAGIDLSAIYIVDNNLAPVMSESYGECELGLTSAGIAFYGYMWEQAAAQGITVMVSSGDSGAAACDDPNVAPPAGFFDGLAVSGLASTPWNVAVGGTDFNQPTPTKYWSTTNAAITQESAKGPIPETTWNNSCTNAIWQPKYGATAEAACNNSTLQALETTNNAWVTGGSGGASGEDGIGFGWTKPSWQTVPPADNARDLPDVSLFASNGFMSSFYVICQSDQTGGPGSCTLDNLQGYGGTSVASPAFAGIMALVNQKHGPQGNANLVLYNLASNQPTAFHDVPAGSTNAMPCLTANGDPDCKTTIGTDTYGVLSGWATTANYDLATGLGSVDAANLVNTWDDVTFTPTTTTLTLSTATITHGKSVQVTVSVAPTSGSGKPTGDIALLVNPGTPGNPGFDWNQLSNGTISWPTSMLPGGTYKVIAHYGGDTTYGGSYSAPTAANITVNPEKSSVYMPGVVIGTDANGNPVYSTSVVYGSGGLFLYFNGLTSYWLRADVENSVPTFCNPPIFDVGPPYVACPTGTISFTDNGKTLDASPYKMNSTGFTEDQTIQLTGGTHTLAATYSGDASYQASSVGGVSITVTPATTFISDVLATPATASAGQQFTVSAVVTTPSYGVAPTGTVSFFYTPTTGGSPTQLPGTTTLTPTNGSVSVGTTAALSAGLTTSIGTAGTYKITATYSGDTNYQAVTAGQSNSAPITITASTSGFTLAANPTSVAITPGGAAGTSVITVTDQGGFSGNVTLAVSAGLPSGVTAQFTPNPTTANTSTLSLLANSSATTGPATLTITGTSGSLNATTTIALTVNQTFTVPATLTAPAAANPGQSTSTTMSVATGSGANFTNNVTFSACSGLPAGATCSFSPPQITAGATSPQTVTITVQTAGPFTGIAGEARRAGTRRAALGPKPRLWLPLSLPLAGMLLVGLAGRRLPRSYKVAALCLALALAGLLVACGGGSSSPPPPITVTVSPSSVSTLYPDLTGAPAQFTQQQFTATVTNTTSQTVTWAVTGGSANGSIDQTGLYTSPATLPSPAAVTITATSSAATSPGTATVNLQTPTPAGTSAITLTVTEGSLTNPTGFSLTVLTVN